MIPYHWVKASVGGRPNGRGAGRSRELGALGERGVAGEKRPGKAALQRLGGPWRRVLGRGTGRRGGMQCVDRCREGRLSVMLQGTCTNTVALRVGWVCLIDTDEAPQGDAHLAGDES